MDEDFSKRLSWKTCGLNCQNSGARVEYADTTRFRAVECETVIEVKLNYSAINAAIMHVRKGGDSHFSSCWPLCVVPTLPGHVDGFANVRPIVFWTFPRLDLRVACRRHNAFRRMIAPTEIRTATQAKLTISCSGWAGAGHSDAWMGGI